MLQEKPYWNVYYDPETVRRSGDLRQEYRVETSGVTLHIDSYQQSDPNAPVILLTHGEGEYSGMFVGLALALYDLGYTTAVLDQRGHGKSSGNGQDFTLAERTQDVLDAAHWARRNYSGPLFMGGTSLGSQLIYQASALGAPVVGLIAHHLYDLPSPQSALSLSRFSGLAGNSVGTQIASAAVKTLMTISPRMRLSYDTLVSFDGLLDERDNGRFEAWQEDPNPPRTVSMRYALSTFSTPAVLPYEDNALPVLVINPTRDRMVDPEMTRRNFAVLGGPKTYVEMDYGHWSMLPPFSKDWASTVDAWVKEVLTR